MINHKGCKQFFMKKESGKKKLEINKSEMKKLKITKKSKSVKTGGAVKASERPELKLVANVEMDINNAKHYVEHGSCVDMFLPESFWYIASKKYSVPERNLLITEFTKHTHKVNAKEIGEGVENAVKQWAKIKGDYFDLVDRIFKGHPWQVGEYTGYASIYRMFPRNLEKKFFYFPYSKNDPEVVSVIGHEMLHFIFFDYIEKYYRLGEKDVIEGKDPRYIWRFSEAFNTVIENWAPYMKIFNNKQTYKPYSECEEIYMAMSKQWAKKKDVKVLLDKFLLK